MSMRYCRSTLLRQLLTRKFFLIGSFVVTGCHAEGASSRELTENGLKTRVVLSFFVGLVKSQGGWEAPGRSKQEAVS